MKKYYCIGLKGTGLSTLAQILSDLGNEVSGYDDVTDYKFTQEGLDSRGIPIYYDQNHEIAEDTIVTYSVAFRKEHPEIKRVEKLGLTIQKYNEVVGEIVDMFETIGVSGTHGKTTTSSLIRHLLEASKGCNYFIGAGDGYVSKENQYFVLESDEFNRHFLAYHPTYSVITNIEAEHLECYQDIEDIRKAFEKFSNQTKKSIVACGDNLEVRKINFQKEVTFYGFSEENDVVVKNVELKEDGSYFDLYIKGVLYDHFMVPLYGKHMVLNATAAIMIGKSLNLSSEEMKKSLKTFHNATRRMEESIVENTIIIDDYAHHPTEIKTTIAAIRQKYPNKKLTVVFKPNTYSRTKDFAKEFVDALQEADKVFLTEIDSNREKPEDYPGISSHLIIDKIEGSEIISEETISKLLPLKDSVICFMSCASISHLMEQLKKILKDS